MEKALFFFLKCLNLNPVSLHLQKKKKKILTKNKFNFLLLLTLLVPEKENFEFNAANIFGKN